MAEDTGESGGPGGATPSPYGLGRSGAATTLRDQALQALPKAAAAVAAVVFSLGFVAALGALMLWARFRSVGLPADQAIAVVPREDLLALGGILLLQYVGIAVAAVMLVRFRDRFGNASPATRRALMDLLFVEIAVAVAVVVVGRSGAVNPWDLWPLLALVVAWQAVLQSIRIAPEGDDYVAVVARRRAGLAAWREQRAHERSQLALDALTSVRQW